MKYFTSIFAILVIIALGKLLQIDSDVEMGGIYRFVSIKYHLGRVESILVEIVDSKGKSSLHQIFQESLTTTDGAPLTLGNSYVFDGKGLCILGLMR